MSISRWTKFNKSSRFKHFQTSGHLFFAENFLNLTIRTIRRVNFDFHFFASYLPWNQKNQPFRPNLTPNYFFLFPHVKNTLRDQSFTTTEEVVTASRMHVLELSQSERQKFFDNSFKCIQKSIDVHGEYSEKQESNFLVLIFALFSFPKYKTQPSFKCLCACSYWFDRTNFVIIAFFAEHNGGKQRRPK